MTGNIKRERKLVGGGGEVLRWELHGISHKHYSAALVVPKLVCMPNRY